jgi:hypothetical protein
MNATVIRPTRDVAQEPARASRKVLAVTRLSWVALVFASVPWQVDVFFDGATSRADLAKALLVMAAWGITFLASRGAPVRSPLPGAYRWVGAFVAISVCSALLGSGAGASVVLSIRMAIFLAAAVNVWRVLGSASFVRTHVLAVAGLFVLTALQGLIKPDQVWEGRLGGSRPPLHPNDLAFAGALVGVAVLAHVFAKGHRLRLSIPALVAITYVLIRTGSRTSLAAFAIAGLLATALAPRLGVGKVAILFATGIACVFLVLSPPQGVRDWWTHRGDARSGTTFTGRTRAWNAALKADRPIAGWAIGDGLSVKDVQLDRSIWQDGKRVRRQVSDSSWVSALMQTGIVGLFMIVAALLTAVRASTRAPAATRVLVTSTLLLLAIRSSFESGLNDVSLAFVSFLALIPAAYQRTRGDRRG